MIGQISPLVKGGSTRRSLYVLHILGGLGGGVLAGALLGSVGIILFWPVPELRADAVLIAVPLACVALGLSDLGLVVEIFTYRRQTPKSLTCTLGESCAVLGWGCDLGCTVTTKLPYQSTFIVPVLAFVSGSVLQSTLIIAAYGIARATATVMAIHEISSAPLPENLQNERVMLMQKRSAGFLTLAFAGAIFVGLIASQ